MHVCLMVADITFWLDIKQWTVWDHLFIENKNIENKYKGIQSHVLEQALFFFKEDKNLNFIMFIVRLRH